MFPARASLLWRSARDLSRALKKPDSFFFIYIVDKENSRRLRGVIPLRDLITADDNSVGKRLWILTCQRDPLSPALRRPTEYLIVTWLRCLSSAMRDSFLGIVTVDAAIARGSPDLARAAPRISREKTATVEGLEPVEHRGELTTVRT